MASLSTFRAVLRWPPALRPILLRTSQAAYHSSEHVYNPPYREAERTILSNAISYVPTHGFTQESLTLGAKDAGYLEVSTNLFPKGPFELVMYHLITQRLALKARVQFPHEQLGIGKKIRSLVLERLRANVDTGILPRWQEALGLMSLAENIPSSLRELRDLSDEMWFLAGDTSVDASWYTKRASLAGIYAATEVYQTTDQSTDSRDTEEFLDRRLEDLRVAGSAVGNAMEWISFQRGAMVNLLRSKGVRI